MTVPAPTNRLTYDDDLFLRSQRVLGIGVTNQIVWRFPQAPRREQVERLHARLCAGRLARLLERSAVPGARDRWVRSGVPGPLTFHDEVLPAGSVGRWLDAVSDTELDAERGPAWRLEHIGLDDGGALLCLMASHVVCDGGAVIAAMREAAGDGPLRRLPLDDVADLTVRRRDDLRDALGQARAAAAGVLGALRSRNRRPPRPAGLTSKDTPIPGPAPGDDEPFRPVTVMATCSTARWHEAAASAGGTANSLLVAVAAELALATGRVRPGQQVRVALPMSMRGEDDYRANASTGVSVTVDTELVDGVGRASDLPTIRARCKVEFAALSAGTRYDPLDAFKPLLQLLPDAALARLARDQPAPLCLASNLGRAPQDYAALFGEEPSALVMRSVPHGATRGGVRRTRGGVAVSFCEHGERSTLCVSALDPDHVPDRAALQGWVEEIAGRWGLPIETL